MENGKSRVVKTMPRQFQNLGIWRGLGGTVLSCSFYKSVFFYFPFLFFQHDDPIPATMLKTKMEKGKAIFCAIIWSSDDLEL